MGCIGFIADPHVGNHRRFGGQAVAGLNVRCRRHIGVLTAAASRAVHEGCSALVVLGDLFDTSSPSPQVVAAVQQALADVPVIVITGNHDIVSDQVGDHACAPLAPVADVVDSPKVLALDAVGVALWAVPFRPGPAREWLSEALAALARDAVPGVRVLALHLGIEDQHTPPYLKGAHDAIPVEQLLALMVEHEITAAFAGNWHRRQKWGDRTHLIQQVGTLCPAGWDDAGLEGYGGLVVLDVSAKPKTRTLELPGPRFVDVSAPGYDEVAVRAAHAAGCTIYARTTGLPGEVQSAPEGAVFAGWDVRPDTAEAQAAARNAALAARSAETLDSALEGFVAAMALPDGVEPEAVLATAKGYLAGRAT